MSTCLFLVHGYIFLLYVYLFNKDVCWEIRHRLFTYFVSKTSQPPPPVDAVDCTNLSEFTSFFKVCCTGWTLEICICVHLNFKILKELGNGLTDVCIFWFSFLSHSLIL